MFKTKDSERTGRLSIPLTLALHQYHTSRSSAYLELFGLLYFKPMTLFSIFYHNIKFQMYALYHFGNQPSNAFLLPYSPAHYVDWTEPDMYTHDQSCLKPNSGE